MDSNTELWLHIHERCRGGYLVFGNYLEPKTHEHIRHCFSGHPLPSADVVKTEYDGVSRIRCEILEFDDDSILARIPVVANEPQSFVDRFPDKDGIVIRLGRVGLVGYHLDNSHLEPSKK